jgi:hypothetical protein
LGWRKNVFNHRTAIFRQINKEKAMAHHDALEFPDGQIVLLITATMLGVPGFYVPRIPGILFQPPGHTRGDELLRYHAAQGDARAPRRVPQAIKVSSAPLRAVID